MVRTSAPWVVKLGYYSIHLDQYEIYGKHSKKSALKLCLYTGNVTVWDVMCHGINVVAKGQMLQAGNIDRNYDLRCYDQCKPSPPQKKRIKKDKQKLTCNKTEPSGIVMRIQNFWPASQRDMILTSSILEYAIGCSMKPTIPCRK